MIGSGLQAGSSERSADNGLCLFLDLAQVILAPKALGVNLVDLFCAGRASGEPAVLGDYFEAANGGVVARGVGQLGQNRLSGQFTGADLSGGKILQDLFLGATGRRIAALVHGAAKLRL